MASTALLTDHYELTMAQAALRSGLADRRCVFEVFARRLPQGRRFGIVGGIGRLSDALDRFQFEPDDLEFLRSKAVVDNATLDWLAGHRFAGDIAAYKEGDAYFPYSPILTVECGFAEGVLLETLILSILNHDSAVASAAARMTIAAAGRGLIEAGSRRTHEAAAVASARMAYLCGFDVTSNLEAARRYGVPSGGTSAHAFILGHESERQAFEQQVATYGPGTTFLVDTFDVATGIDLAVNVTQGVGNFPGAIRIDSGDLLEASVGARAQLDSLGAVDTKIVVSGDLDEYEIARLTPAPIDRLMVGTQLVTGSGAPTAGFVYKLVSKASSLAADAPMVPVAKRSAMKPNLAGKKYPYRHYRDGHICAELFASEAVPVGMEPLQHPIVVDGEVLARLPLAEIRQHFRGTLERLPLGALALDDGEPALVCHHGHENQARLGP